MTKEILIAGIIDMPTEGEDVIQDQYILGQGVLIACPDCQQILPYNSQKITWPHEMVRDEIRCRICDHWYVAPKDINHKTS